MLRGLLLSITLILTSFSVSAQELPLSVDATPTPGKKYECTVEFERVTNDLMKDVACTHDEECSFYDYGYPFQQEACVKAIVNRKEEGHNITNIKLIEEYRNNCTYNNETEQKKYDALEKELSDDKCEAPRVYCFKGFCRREGYAVYNDE